MRLKLRIALLMCLAAAAVYMGGEAWRSLRPASDSLLPEEVYERYLAGEDMARFYLRDSGGYVAVYERARDKTPMLVTDIELSCLRSADRAMVESGIPVLDRQELLQLLEDLGS